jgi:hypothetical protein
MNETQQAAIAQIIHATAEILGHEIKPAAAMIMVDDLSEHPFDSVMASLKRCRQEIKGRLTLADILERLHIADGRPTSNEAWAIALKSMDENETVVINDEIAESLTYAREIFNSGDEIGARMAFRDSYERISKLARSEGKPVKWWPSFGTDLSLRQSAVEAGVVAGLLSSKSLALLPHPPATMENLLTHAGDGVSPEVAAERISMLKSVFGDKPERKPMTQAETEARRKLLLDMVKEKQDKSKEPL